MHEMEKLKIFESSEFGKLEVVTIEGRPYFPATACAKILGYVNPRDAIKRHCKVEGVVKRDGVSFTVNQHGKSSEQIVQTNFISEGNLYRLIVHSKLPAAERFESWVFDEVLPSIRQTGGYLPDMKELAMQVVTAAVAETMRQLIPLVKEVFTAAASEPAPRFSLVKEHAEPAPNRCKLETFPFPLREQVDAMIEEMQKEQALNFSRIARFCTLQGYTITSPSVRTYYNKHYPQEEKQDFCPYTPATSKITRWGIPFKGKHIWNEDILLHLGEEVKVEIEGSSLVVRAKSGEKITALPLD